MLENPVFTNKHYKNRNHQYNLFTWNISVISAVKYSMLLGLVEILTWLHGYETYSSSFGKVLKVEIDFDAI